MTIFKYFCFNRTCLIGIKLIDGVIWPSWCREFCSALLIKDCELLGAFEFESAECGDGEPPFNGRWLLFTVDACMSNKAELMLVGNGSVWTFPQQDRKLSVIWNWFFEIKKLSFTLNVSFSAIEISTCGVRKCIGGVPFSFDRRESYTQQNIFSWTK